MDRFAVFAGQAVILLLVGCLVPVPAYSNNDAELRCLALNIYWEARSLPPEGQRAVAFVTINRVRSADFPNSVCDVVQQGGETPRWACQFSWWCDGRGDAPKNDSAWKVSVAMARKVLGRTENDPTDGALYYHLN